jgi:hypothetical protein
MQLRKQRYVSSFFCLNNILKTIFNLKYFVAINVMVFGGFYCFCKSLKA